MTTYRTVKIKDGWDDLADDKLAEEDWRVIQVRDGFRGSARNYCYVLLEREAV
jgi:hypothetical protein